MDIMGGMILKTYKHKGLILANRLRHGKPCGMIHPSATPVHEGRGLNVCPLAGAPFNQKNQDIFAECLTQKQIHGFPASSFVKMYMHPAKSSMQPASDRNFVYFWIVACI